MKNTTTSMRALKETIMTIMMAIKMVTRMAIKITMMKRTEITMKEMENNITIFDALVRSKY